MQYGYFDMKNKEYVITRPDTPAPWVNYLGSPAYGAIISNNAAGYSFVQSGANGRISRFRFNSMMALPGRYIYLRDAATGDYWSATWQPVGKPLDTYHSECRHGTAYSVMTSTYADIRTETTYYVPEGQSHEVWQVKLRNTGTTPRTLSVFGFVEFTNDSNYEQDQVNLQYTQFITRTERKGNKILQHINEFSELQADGSNHKERFFGLAGADAVDGCGSLEQFIGPYRTYSNPIMVEQGTCRDAMNYNANSCGVLRTELTLQPGQTQQLVFLLGQKTDAESEAILAAYQEAGRADRELQELKACWHSRLANFEVDTPSDAFNQMLNVWNAYQCFITFIWSRAASFSYCGLRNGYGYRDTVQDIQGIIHLAPEMALEKIRFMLSAQVDNGAGLPLVKFHHNAGHENTPDDAAYVKETGHPSYRADDALWLFPTIRKYIAETGNRAFLEEVIVYANGGEATVYEHLKQAIAFSLAHMGKHHMPAGLHADWNDCLRLGADGESTFVAFQLYDAMKTMQNMAAEKQDTAYLAFLEQELAALHAALERCWDEDRFIRGIREDDVLVGQKSDPEANMWLNPQSWSVISGFADKEQGEQALQSVETLLNTPYGAKLLDPPYRKHYFDGALMQVYNPDTKENGGIFSQSQGWLILAESLSGHGDRAFRYFAETSPAMMNDRAEIRCIEPYAHGQFTESTASAFAGRSHVHWLTGTASTVMVGCVEGICGIRPDADGILINPAIPHEWESFRMKKYYRGKKLSVLVLNPNHVESGVKSASLNQKAQKTAYFAYEDLQDMNEIIITLG